MNKEELEDKLSKLQAGDEVYSKEEGWHTFYSFDPAVKYPVRCSEEDSPTSPHCYTMGGLYQIDSPCDWDRNISDVRFLTRTMTIQPTEIAEVKAPFADARVGDMVWDSFERGYTHVIEIKRGDLCPIKTYLGNFDYDGASEGARDIYWQAPTNNPPERVPGPMTSEEFLLAAWELFKLAEKVGYSYSYDNTEERKSLHIWDIGSIMSSCTTAREDLAEFKRRLESA